MMIIIRKLSDMWDCIKWHMEVSAIILLLVAILVLNVLHIMEVI